MHLKHDRGAAVERLVQPMNPVIMGLAVLGAIAGVIGSLAALFGFLGQGDDGTLPNRNIRRG